MNSLLLITLLGLSVLAPIVRGDCCHSGHEEKGSLLCNGIIDVICF